MQNRDAGTEEYGLKKFIGMLNIKNAHLYPGATQRFLNPGLWTQQWPHFVLPPIFLQKVWSDTATKTNSNYKLKWWNIHYKMIEIFTTWIFYLEFKVNNKNDMPWHAILTVFCSSQQASKISPTAENDEAANLPPIFFLACSLLGQLLIFLWPIAWILCLLLIVSQLKALY